MDASKQHSIQYDFLLKLKTSKQTVSVFLQSGIQLRGQLVDFDSNALVLQRDGVNQLVYHHVVSTVCLTSSVEQITSVAVSKKRVNQAEGFIGSTRNSPHPQYIEEYSIEDV